METPVPPLPEEAAPVFPAFSETAVSSEQQVLPEQEAQPVAESLPGTEFLASLAMAAEEEVQPAAAPMPEPVAAPQPSAPKVSWMAEPAEVTPEDAKLFERPSSDWEGLTKMVEAADAPPPESSPSAGTLDTLAVAPQEVVPPAIVPKPQPEPVAEAQPQAPPEVSPEVVSYAPLEEPAPASEHTDADLQRIEHLIRETLQEMMPQIVDRIVRQVSVALRREEK